MLGFLLILFRVLIYTALAALSYITLAISSQWIGGRMLLPLLPALSDNLIRWGLLRTNNVYSRLFDRIHKSVVIIGLDASGKSTLLYKYLSQCPTQSGTDVFVSNPDGILGATHEVISLPSATFTAVHMSIRMQRYLWGYPGPTVLEPLDGLILVIDASDRQHLADLRYLLEEVKRSAAIPMAAPILVLANKHDWEYAADEEEIAVALALDEFVNPLGYYQCSMTNYIGVFEGLKWLAEALRDEPLNYRHEFSRSEIREALSQMLGNP